MDPLSLLARAHDAGLDVAIAGDKLVVRGPRRAEPVVRLPAEHKPAVMAALSAHWRARYREAVAYWGALHSSVHAMRLAWGELQNRWHRLHGKRAPAWQCAGCDAPIGGLAALDLADGNHVHLDQFYCLLSFDERWRSEATAGLRAFGLDPPPGFEPL